MYKDIARDIVIKNLKKLQKRLYLNQITMQSCVHSALIAGARTDLSALTLSHIGEPWRPPRFWLALWQSSWQI